LEGKEKEIAPLIESRYHLHPLSSSLKNFLRFLGFLLLVYGLGFFKWFLVSGFNKYEFLTLYVCGFGFRV
jgi:hypothetical protein